MKKIKKTNTAKRVKIVLEEDDTLVSYGGGLLEQKEMGTVLIS